MQYNQFRGLTAPAESVVARDHHRSPFGAAEPHIELHNPRGFVLAIMMSAACWVGVALAFLI
ncbi:hypothetical protein [uncultured Novosphingobium sp.]|uniref:hypothetical protein n=1 Tax=uncultured Novosphingobium sp. TaxID=292277 RepID=UPI000AAA0576|nr:hypothetical protein [uncultured Novosphingobium sp.]